MARKSSEAGRGGSAAAAYELDYPASRHDDLPFLIARRQLLERETRKVVQLINNAQTRSALKPVPSPAKGP